MKISNVPSLCFLGMAFFLSGCKSVELAHAKNHQSVSDPEDILADKNSFTTFHEGNTSVTARKGTIAASVKNAMRLTDPTCTQEEREQLLSWFKEYAKTLAVIFQGQLNFTNPEIQQMLNQAAVEVDKLNGKKV